MHSEMLNKAKDDANKAFDEHCTQWDLLQKIPQPTISDLDKWLEARNTFFVAQDKFEKIVRQIYG